MEESVFLLVSKEIKNVLECVSGVAEKLNFPVRFEAGV